MATSAAERASALQPVVEAARQQVGELEARFSAMTAAAQARYVEGDQVGGDAAHAIAADAARELETARARLATLEQAEQVVSRERTQDEWRAQLAAAEEELAAALDESMRQQATILPALAAAKQAIRAAEAAELAAKQADGRVHGLRAALAGQPVGSFRSNVQGVSVALERSALLREVRNSTEF